MPLPSVCPKAKNVSCTGDACPMYIIEWRSKDEYCMIGYSTPGSGKKLGMPAAITYSSDLDTNNGPVMDKLEEISEPEHASEIKAEKPKILMDMGDIPEDYEEQFWG